MTESLVVLGLGSNKYYLFKGRLFTPRSILQEAIRALEKTLRSLRVAPLYETEPLHVTDQPHFLNTAVCGVYSGEPQALLAEIHAIEAAWGRNRSIERRFGERTLDIDILLFGGRAINEIDLVIPHPRLYERAFALVPLFHFFKGAPCTSLFPSDFLKNVLCTNDVSHNQSIKEIPWEGVWVCNSCEDSSVRSEEFLDAVSREDALPLFKDISGRGAFSQDVPFKIAFFLDNLNEEYQRSVYRGIRAEAARLGIDLLCVQGESLDAENVFPSLKHIHVDGILILTTVMYTTRPAADASTIRARLDEIVGSTPIVSIGDMPPYPSVSVNNDKSMQKLIDHLITHHGYRNFLYMGGPIHNVDNAARERVVRNEAAFCGGTCSVIHGDFRSASGKDIIRAYIHDHPDDPPDAIVAGNDTMAHSAQEILHVQSDPRWRNVAVTGFDDIPFSRLDATALTTVRQPLDEQTREAVRMLAALIKAKKEGNFPSYDKDDYPHKKIESELLVRNSCGCTGYADDPSDVSRIAEIQNTIIHSEYHMQLSNYFGRRLLAAETLKDIIPDLRYFFIDLNISVLYLFIYPEAVKEPASMAHLVFCIRDGKDTFYETGTPVDFHTFFKRPNTTGRAREFCLCHLNSNSEYLGIILYEAPNPIHHIMNGAVLFIAVAIKRFRTLADEKNYMLRLEKEVALRTKTLEEEAKRRIAVEAEVLRISEMERMRFSLDLHDDICQRLASISMMSRVLAQGLNPHILLSDLSDMIDETLSRTRQYAHTSFPMDLDSCDLNDALKRLCDTVGKNGSFSCIYTWTGNADSPLTHAHDINVYRIIQEALANAAKHAKASTVEVSIDHTDAEFVIIVRDNGKGDSRLNSGEERFSSAAPPKRRREGLGLRSMRYRAHQIGATYSFTSSKETGTRIELRIPLNNRSTSLC